MPPAGVTGAIREAAQADRRELRISARHRQGRVQPQSQRQGADLVGDRAVPVHRADLARHDEAGGRGARLRQLCRRDHAARRRPLRGRPIRRCAARSSRCARIRPPMPLMAGAFTQAQCRRSSTERLGRKPTDGELYIAHFLGAGGAAQLISAARAAARTPSRGDVSRARPRANRSIFYDRQGNARSVAGVYAGLDRRYQVARAASPASRRRRRLPRTSPRQPARSRRARRPQSRRRRGTRRHRSDARAAVAPTADAAPSRRGGVRERCAASRRVPPAFRPRRRSTRRVPDAVPTMAARRGAPVVRELWGARGSRARRTRAGGRHAAEQRAAPARARPVPRPAAERARPFDADLSALPRSGA